MKEIYCEGTKLEVELAKYKKENYYNYQAWRKDNQKLIHNAQQIIELEGSLSNLHWQFQELQISISGIKNQIDALRKLNDSYYKAKVEVIIK